MVTTAVLLDGDFTRRLIKRKLGHSPNVVEIETFCKGVLTPDETLLKIYYYDCPPFGAKKQLPVSKAVQDFSTSPVYAKAAQFQQELRKNQTFVARRGHLSFDGWTLKGDIVEELLKTPRPLVDGDFKPILKQKQVDMKIGFDVAKLSMKGIVKRILLATSDADFIPAIHFARNYKIEVILLTDVPSIRKTKGTLLKTFTAHRVV